MSSINTEVKEIPEFDALHFSVDRQKYGEILDDTPGDIVVISATDREIQFLFPIEDKEEIQRYIH